MLPFILSVACNNGTFTNGTCFGEAWLRATNGGQPTGAIATYMSYISQSWDPPMCGQDEVVDLLVQDQIVIVSGEVAHDDFTGGLAVKAQSISTLAQARQNYAAELPLYCKLRHCPFDRVVICNIDEGAFPRPRGSNCSK